MIATYNPPETTEVSQLKLRKVIFFKLSHSLHGSYYILFDVVKQCWDDFRKVIQFNENHLI
jgi:hypothetical protein